MIRIYDVKCSELQLSTPRKNESIIRQEVQIRALWRNLTSTICLQIHSSVCKIIPNLCMLFSLFLLFGVCVHTNVHSKGESCVWMHKETCNHTHSDTHLQGTNRYSCAFTVCETPGPGWCCRRRRCCLLSERAHMPTHSSAMNRVCPDTKIQNTAGGWQHNFKFKFIFIITII